VKAVAFHFVPVIPIPSRIPDLGIQECICLWGMLVGDAFRVKTTFFLIPHPWLWVAISLAFTEAEEKLSISPLVTKTLKLSIKL